ncbi:MAG: PorP/SprF family type IX secretion system membrane protein [Bacteroidota bacterium]
MKKYFIIGAFLLSTFSFSAFGQDIHFSQYNLTPLIINPAQAGAYKNIEAILSYKSQWTSISPNAYKTVMLAYDQRMMQKKWKTSWLTGGINLFQDKAGDGNMKTMQGNIAFGYHTMLNDKNVFGGALFAGFAQRSIDYSALTWDEQYQNGVFDPINNPSGEVPLQNNNKFGYPDFGLGILYQYNKGQRYSTGNSMVNIHAGLSLFHLNTPTYSYYSSGEKIYMKVLGHADALIGIKRTNLAIAPGFLYMGQGPSSEILPGCYFRYMLREESQFTGFVKGASIMIGTHLRLKDAFIPSVQLEVAEYTIGLSYDTNVSGLKSATSGKGGFEIHLRYGNPNPFLYKSAASFQ